MTAPYLHAPQESAPDTESDRGEKQSAADTHFEGHAPAPQVDATRKRFEDYRARLALAGGYALHELADGSFLICRWNLTRPCADLAAVRAFLERLGGC